jgi:signal transduction histidine kinase
MTVSLEILTNPGAILLLAASLINDILDFSKIEAGRMELEIIPFDIQGEISDLMELFAEAARGKGLELVSLISSGVP